MKQLELESEPFGLGSIIINKERLVDEINKISNINEMSIFKREVLAIVDIIKYSSKDDRGLVNIDTNGDTISIKKTILIGNLNQILSSKTLPRAKYYLERLEKSLSKIKTNKINEINLYRWKEYDSIITDSLWVLDKRDTSGAHLGWYWGNFIPQIPHQLILRFTKKYDWIIDPFAGSGTTLIEAKRLGRNCLGIELNSEVVSSADKLIKAESNKYNVNTNIICSDSRNYNYSTLLAENNIKKIQLIIMHPPYFDIIKFSNNPNDLSNAKSITNYLSMFGEVLDNAMQYLEKGRFLAVVIGDKYSRGEWIPLGFMCMNEILKRKLQLKSIIVKNFDNTRGKRAQHNLWRYRALVGGFYIFKHEYILIFKKK